jgi:hypothetical protein
MVLPYFKNADRGYERAEPDQLEEEGQCFRDSNICIYIA